MLKRYRYFYFAILKFYQTAIQYMGNITNITLSLVVTPTYDKKKLAMPISGFMQQHSSRQHQQRFIEFEYICQYV